MKSGKVENAKMSKRNKLLLNILLVSIAVVFCLLSILVYINYYTRVRLVLTTVSRYKTGEIKNVTEYDVIDVKKGRNLSNLPAPFMEGYTFEGWFKDIDYKEPFDYNEQLVSHMQIYGKFELIEYNIELVLDEDVKVSYNTTRERDYTIPYTIEDIILLPKDNDLITLNDGSEIKISDYKAEHKYGYTFEGWGMSSNAATTYTDDYPMRAQNLTFYAVWRPVQVELRYMSQDLDFTGANISNLRPRIDEVTGGLKYIGQYTTFNTIYTQFNDKVEAIQAPVDKYSNLEFAGWYLDPEFLVPLKLSQLYVKSGYFTMTQNRDINILNDPLYFDVTSITDEHRQTIKSYSSTDEKNSYITLFAKWTPIRYTIKFDLNLPFGQNYIDTTTMAGVITKNFNSKITSDDGSTVKTSVASQGWKILRDESELGILHDMNYFKDVVYRENDETGLPLYTILSWNTLRDGTGYTLGYDSQVYFDKSNFNIVDGTITLYAQWKSYYRLNYYYSTYGSTGFKNIRLGTVNVEKNTINLPTFSSLVKSISTSGLIEFTDYQTRINNLRTTYSVPLNKSFIGWSNSSDMIIGATPIYIAGYDYDIGNHTKDENGIYLNSAEKNMYAVFMDNDNYFTYDLNTSQNDVVSFSDNDDVKKQLIDENGKAVVYRYSTTQASYVLSTVSDDKYLITKTDGNKDYILWGWTLKDGTEIDGAGRANPIRFNSEYLKYIYNSETYTEKYTGFNTLIYFDGKVQLETDTYYTVYNQTDDVSTLYLKIPAKLLTFTAKWIENVIITFDDGADDVEWLDGKSAADFTMLGAGNLYITMPDLPKTTARRPGYEFVGWTTIDREGEGINYGDFMAEHADDIYYATQKYQSFSKDTLLYALWKPVIFTININQLAYGSAVNYSAGLVYISKEKFSDGRREVTDEILFSGNVIKYYTASGEEKSIILNTSSVVGKGFAGWNNNRGEELKKGELGYAISVKNDENKLFNMYPTSTNDYYVNIYPIFEDLKFTITFKLSGTGIEDGTPNHVETDINYGVNVKTLLNNFTMPHFLVGYEYSGWLVSGDKEKDGTIKPDYVVDVKTSNLLVKSDLVLTLVASKQTFNVRFIFNNPITGQTEIIKNYLIEYYDIIDSVLPEIEAELSVRQYLGYNFSSWRVSGGGSSSTFLQLNAITITSPLDIYPIYNPARVEITYNYYSDLSDKDDKMETYVDEVYIGNLYTITSSNFLVAPVKNDSILNGWKLMDGGKVYVDGEKLSVLSGTLKDYLIEQTDGIEKYYILNLYADWSEAVKLTFDTTGVYIYGIILPNEVIVSKGSRLYLSDIEGLSSLRSDQVYKNGKSVFTGRWADQNGVEYDAYLATTYILMDEHKVLTPVFESISYTVEYYYKYSNKYYALSGASQKYAIDYATPMNLLSHDELTAYLWQTQTLKDYDCIALYLGQVAYETMDQNLKLEMGAPFDFANIQKYFDQAQNNTFKMYLDLRKYTNITYYMDRSNSASTTVVRLVEGTSYVVGTSASGLSEADIIPTKNGYTFKGWSKTLSSTNVDYQNGYSIDSYISEMFVRLYPVWETVKITVSYYEYNGNLMLNETYECFSTITLLGDTVVEGYRLIGWKIPGSDTIYGPRTSYTLSDTDVEFHAVRERYYTIYYYNNLGSFVTFDEQIVVGENFTPRSFDRTGMTSKTGSEFGDWSFEKDIPALVGGSLVINSRDGLSLNLGSWTVTLDGEDDYILKLYAYWIESYYTATFVSRDEQGSGVLYYAKVGSPNTLVSTSQSYLYDETIQYFNFPSTALRYTEGGDTYKFTGVWTDASGKTYDTSESQEVAIRFVQNYEFTPVYKRVIALVFKAGQDEVYSSDEALSGTQFDMGDASLVAALNSYNQNLAGKKIVGWISNGVYYSHLNPNDQGYNYQNWSRYASVTESMEFEAVIADVITLQVYTKVNYDKTSGVYSFDETSKVTLDGNIIGDIVNLNGYSLTDDYDTFGWVVSKNSSYNYNKDATDLTSSITLSESVVADSKTLYLYPLVAVKVKYAVNTIDNVVKTSFVVMGNAAPAIDYILSDDNYYLGDWMYSNGTQYNGEPITEPLTLLASSMPYYTIQMADSENRIDNSLIFQRLTPKSQVVIPADDDRVIYDKLENGGGLKLTGWYIKDVATNAYVMEGGKRKVFAFGTLITIQKDLIDKGLNSSSYTYGLVPIFDYTLLRLKLVNLYDALEYKITASDGNVYYHTSSSYYEFSVLKNSGIVAENNQLRFEAYQVEDGQIVYNGYDPVKSVVTIERRIKTGYEAYLLTDGWFTCVYDTSTNKYTKGSALMATSKMGENIAITANEPTASTITVMVGLADEYSNAITNTARGYFISGENRVSEFNTTIKAGNAVSISLYLVDGYELGKNSLSDIIILNEMMQDITGTLSLSVSINNGVASITYRATKTAKIYFVLKPCSEVKLKLKLDSSVVDKLNDLSVDVYYDSNYQWKFLETIEFESLKSGLAVTNGVIPSGAKIKLTVTLDSAYYYVKSLVLSGTEDGTQTINSSNLEGYRVTLAPVVTIVLDARTFSVDYYFDGTLMESSDSTELMDNNEILLKTYTAPSGKTFGGYKIIGQNSAGQAVLIRFVTSPLDASISVSISDLIKNTTNITSKNTVIKLDGICYANSVQITISGEENKSKVNGQLSQTYNVPIGSKVTVNGSTLSMLTGTYSLDVNGDLIGVTNTTIALTMLGSYKFGKWLKDGGEFSEFIVDSETTIVGTAVVGDSTLNISVEDLSETSGCNLQGIDVVTISAVTSKSQEFTTYYDATLKNNTYSSIFTTGAKVEMDYTLANGFILNKIILTYNGISSENYSSLSEFANVCGINISQDGTKLVILEAIYDLNIRVVVERQSYSVKTTLVRVSQSSSELDTLYNNLMSSGETFATVDGSAIVSNESLISTALFRKILKFNISANSDYFELNKILVNGVSVFPEGQVDYASFDVQSNILTLYSGGNGEDIVISVGVTFKTFRVVFHKPDNSEFSTNELTGNGINSSTSFDYNHSAVFNASDFVSINEAVTISGRSYKFTKWMYYNGDYEADALNNAVDMTKLTEISDLNYTFNKDNGDLHLFGVWEDLYSIVFTSSGTATNMPNNRSNIELTEEISLDSIPNRDGFEFRGWYYVYDGTTYFLNYNGTKFEKLTDASGTPKAVDTSDINGLKLTLNNLITSTQLNSTLTSSFKLTMQARWEAKQLSITLNYDSTMCEIVEQIYVSGNYSDGKITFNYGDTLTPDTVDGYNVIVVRSYEGVVKGRIICKPTENYEFKEFRFNGNILVGSATLTTVSTIDVICWGKYVGHTVAFSWDKLFSDAVGGTHYGSNGGHPTWNKKYNFTLSLSFYDIATGNAVNSGVGVVKAMSLDGRAVNTFDITSTCDYINNFDIASLMVSLRIGYGVKVSLDLTNTPYVIDLNEYSFVTGDSSAYKFDVETTDEGVGFNLLTGNVKLSHTYEDATQSDFGKYELVRYVAVKNSDGFIESYDVEQSEYSALTANDYTVNIVAESEITINYNSNDFVLDFVTGSTEAKLNNDSWKFATDWSGTLSYNLHFAPKYIKYNFNINNSTYASAYFNTSLIDSNADKKLQAFYKLITYGYNTVSADAEVKNMLVTSASSTDDPTNIIKSISPVTYYTYGELLVDGYKYAVNDNIAKTMQDNAAFKNAWFEEWLIKLTFGDDATEKNLAVSGISDVVTVNAGHSDAIVFSLYTDVEVGANGGTMFENIASVNYNYSTIKTKFSYRNDGNNYYSEIVLKIKNNTNLPQFRLGYDNNSWVSGTNYAVACNGKVIGTSSTAGIVAEDGEYNATTIIKLKKLKLNVSTNIAGINGGVVYVSYATTFEEILSQLGLKYNYYLDDITKSVYYSILGFYIDDECIDENDINFDNYFNKTIGAAYAHGNELDVVIKYQEYNKTKLSITAKATRNGAASDELSKIYDFYYVVNSDIAGTYTGDFDTYVANSYKARTHIDSTEVGFNNANIMTLNGSTISLSSTLYSSTFCDMTSSEYKEIFLGWQFAYLTLDALDVGLGTSGTYMTALENVMPDTTPLNVNIDETVRKSNSTPKNLKFVMNGETTMYAIFVPVITIRISSENYLDELGEVEHTILAPERVSVTLSNLVAIYRNKLIASGVDLSEFEADYVVVDGSNYQLKTGGSYNYIAYISKQNNEIIIKIVWKKAE